MKTFEEFVTEVEKTLTPESLAFYKECGGINDEKAKAMLTSIYENHKKYGTPEKEAIKSASACLTMEF